MLVTLLQHISKNHTSVTLHQALMKHLLNNSPVPLQQLIFKKTMTVTLRHSMLVTLHRITLVTLRHSMLVTLQNNLLVRLLSSILAMLLFLVLFIVCQHPPIGGEKAQAWAASQGCGGTVCRSTSLIQAKVARLSLFLVDSNT